MTEQLIHAMGLAASAVVQGGHRSVPLVWHFLLTEAQV